MCLTIHTRELKSVSTKGKVKNESQREVSLEINAMSNALTALKGSCFTFFPFSRVFGRSKLKIQISHLWYSFFLWNDSTYTHSQALQCSCASEHWFFLSAMHYEHFWLLSCNLFSARELDAWEINGAPPGTVYIFRLHGERFKGQQFNHPHKIFQKL